MSWNNELLLLFCLSCSALITSPECASGDIRLTGGSDQYSGKVEICDDGVYNAICVDEATVEVAVDVCRQLFGNTSSIVI